MRKFFFLLLVLFNCPLNAQNKYDYNWILNNETINDYILVNWKSQEPNISIIHSSSWLSVWDNNASISDKDGNFKFFSNGCVIAGKNLYTLLNGNNINPGYVHNGYCGFVAGGNTYPAFNSLVFLPKPEDSTHYFLFHTIRSASSDSNSVTYPFVWLLYSEIDSRIGANGAVIKKNIQLGPRDSLSEIGPIACRHSNGVDWWVIVPTLYNHSFYRALLTKKGAEFIGKQVLTSPGQRNPDDWAGQGVFSPDGRKYIRTDPQNGTFVYEFDRCTGLMSSPVFIDTLVISNYSGVSVSPNSKYLYISNSYVLHQFDLTSADIPASKIKIAFLDTAYTTANGLYVNFYKSLLAPDGKIYVGSTHGVDWLNVIHHPDEKGLACDFRQHDLQLLKDYDTGLPNMPHFRMPAQEGVICPPVVASQERFDQQFIRVYPNPTKGNIILENFALPDDNCTVSKRPTTYCSIQ
ncbi:MAG: hypothetical protein ACOYOA_13060 [Saprospiraceae bacterium]